jgi:hypothetical protein
VHDRCGWHRAQGLVLSPTLLLKTRVMTDPVFRQEYVPSQAAALSVGESE